MRDFSFQGKVYLGNRDAVTGKSQALRWVDDAAELQVKLSVDTEERTESYSGNKLTSVRLQKAKKAEFSLKLNAFSKLNLALGLATTPIDVTTGTVTAEPLPTGLVAGDVVQLDKRDVSSVVVSDSAVTPATLIAGTDYVVDSAANGIVKILNVGSYTQPFKAAYSNAAAIRLPMFTAGVQERFLVLDGINTVDNSRVRVSLYRCSFDPISQLDMITDSLSSLDLSGAVLFDTINAADANMGGFGRIDLPAEV
ncbi:hypothetical protein [Rhodanobacter denitrificans]|uniref:Uncharacterized protein n=1 Tax=Rhodanobacter denitrificans TaxID=666685 RepID=M4NGA6_9GAMM|nr:hypothetical protein [Rhodanobacter denitrificans]AGG89929.1 hypothetical protein R2APBS1_2852 [Rhodanobacter denitrificans]UJM85325.1 hypothetical protein LRJ86_11095 [Rhodanobacter denitrificans]